MFLLEQHQHELATAVDEIMQDLQSGSNDLSYKKVFYETENSQAAFREGEKMWRM